MMCVFLYFLRYDVCFLFWKAISCFSEAGTEATECQSAADCKSNQVSLHHILTKFFFSIFFGEKILQILSQVCYLPTNTCKDQLIMELSQMSSCTKVVVMVMVMASNFSFLTLPWIIFNFFQSSDCNDNEICYLDTKVSILDFKQEKDCSSL